MRAGAKSVLALIAIPTMLASAHAEPPPVARIGERCPVGYTPRGHVCIPMLGQRCRVIPKQDTCPVGFSTSAEHYCIETNCRSQ